MPSNLDAAEQRVLIVHNSYRQRGGEDTVVANEFALLERHGWHPRLWRVTNDGIVSTFDKIATALRAPYSGPARDALARAIADFSPAVVHVHNFFRCFLLRSTTHVARPMSQWCSRCIITGRFCAGALLSRDRRPCEDCVGGSPYQGALHCCYRGSRLGSLAVAWMVDTHRRRGTWSLKVDCFIALSAFAKGKFVAAGFPADRIAVKPNFTEDRLVSAVGARAGALFVGRLSPEKGVATLLRAWDGLDVPLRIVGDGPLHELIDNVSSPRVTALGWKTAEEVAAEMAEPAFLVLPSQVYENFPIVSVEAFCQGLPVIAARIGALAGIVENRGTGLLFSAGDAADLACKVRWAVQNPAAMQRIGANTRRAYEQKYSLAVNYRQLTDIYQRAIAQSRAAGTR